MTQKEKIPTENHTNPMVSVIYTIPVNKENPSLFMNSICGKTIIKVETSSLKNLKIVPRNLNEIVLS